MPEALVYSTICAVHTLWLAARAEGIGLGWVSILDPATVSVLLDVPADWHFIGILCLGYPKTEAELPATARRYLARIGELLGRPVTIVSVGPDRDQTIIRRHPFG